MRVEGNFYCVILILAEHDIVLALQVGYWPGRFINQYRSASKREAFLIIDDTAD